MHQLKLMSEAPPPAVLALAWRAAEAPLVLCVGAGVSKGDPSGLGLGAEVSRKTYDSLRVTLGPSQLEGVDPDNLLSLADKVEILNGGRDLLQALLPGIDRFTSAMPNISHQVLSALALEGAVSILSTNWDNCIERAAPVGWVLRVVVTEEDRSRVAGPHLLKVHGCATRRGTLLVSSAQLADPPIWVEHEIGGRLADSFVVFVGLGDVAEYVQVRLAQLVADLRPENIRLVAPSISPKWDSLLPDLAEEHKLRATSDDFLDDLLRAYAMIPLTRLSEKVTGHVEAGDFEGCNIDLELGKVSLLRVLESCTGLQLVDALARVTFDWPDGQPVLLSSEISASLLAVCVLAADGKLAGLDEGLWVFTHGVVALVVCREAQSYDVVREAYRRLENLRAVGHVDTSSLIFIVEGHEGPLPAELFDVVGSGSEQDVVDGALMVSPRLVSVASLLAGDLPDGWVAA